MITKIIACGDIHVPSYKGIDLLRPVMTNFLEKCKKIAKEEGPENIRIVVLGDIFDQKITITNESLLCVDWFFSELDKIAKTIVIVIIRAELLMTKMWRGAFIRHLMGLPHLILKFIKLHMRGRMHKCMLG